MRMASFLRTAAVALLLIMAAFGYFMLRDTRVAAWIPLGISATAGLACGIGLRRFAPAITGFSRTAAAAVTVGAAGAILMFFALLLTNTCGADREHPQTVSGTVISKHVRTEAATRRVGRRYVRDSSRKIYHYEYTLMLPDSTTVRRTTDAAGYRRLRIGAHRKVEILSGKLGWPVVR